MIPKIIHYCWFGKGTKNRLIKRCINSWKVHMPEYEIKCWSEENFDCNSIQFVKEAYGQRKWAFVADYVRLYALFQDGGIYLDTDSEVYKSFDVFLNNDFFVGTDCWDSAQTQFAISAGFIGAHQNHPFIKHCMDHYENTKFILDSGRLNQMIIPDILSKLLEPCGYERVDKTQTCIYKKHEIRIYSTDFFINNFYQTSKGTYGKHWGEDSWGLDHRGIAFNFFKKCDLMCVYNVIEQLVRCVRRK